MCTSFAVVPSEDLYRALAAHLGESDGAVYRERRGRLGGRVSHPPIRIGGLKKQDASGRYGTLTSTILVAVLSAADLR
jgi:hypothetical protein